MKGFALYRGCFLHFIITLPGLWNIVLFQPETTIMKAFVISGLHCITLNESPLEEERKRVYM